MELRESVLSHIDKLVGTLKDEKELKEILKRKFTKKEFKVFTAMEDKKEVSEIAILIHDEEERVDELYKAACKKLNQEKIKQELVNL